jgi:hypothetical protein
LAQTVTVLCWGRSSGDRATVLNQLSEPAATPIDAPDADGRRIAHDMARSEALFELIDALARYVAAARERPLSRLSSLP